MMPLGVATIGGLTGPIAAAFTAAPADFWAACARQDAGTRVAVRDNVGLREQVREALEYLDTNAQAAPLLPDLLLARPGDELLRLAVGAALPAALAAVPDARFAVERAIVQALGSAQAKALHDSLDRIDVLQATVTAYKAMHDALHVLQPQLTLMRGVAAAPERWREFKAYQGIFRLQLALVDAAGQRLAANGVTRSLDFREAIGEVLERLAAAVASAHADDVKDAVSELAMQVGDALSSVDVLMRDAAEEANEPFARSLTLFQPLLGTQDADDAGQLIASYVTFARQTSEALMGAVAEHGRWQKLDRQLEQLQRAIDPEADEGGRKIASVWKMTARDLNELCAGPPPPEWAGPIVTLIGLADAGLKPPISPPVATSIVDHVNDIVNSGRDRFMAVDQSLLDWLGKTVTRRPALVSLLQGGSAAGD